MKIRNRYRKILMAAFFALLLEAKPENVLAMSEPSVHIRQWRISSQNFVPDQKAQALLETVTNRDLTMEQMKNVAEQLTKQLQNRGYPVARAYLPEQVVQDGVATITIAPGFYGEIVIRNHTGIATSVLRTQLGNVRSGALIRVRDLERALLLLGDLGGLEAHGTLMPGKESGKADLLIVINSKTKNMNGSIGVNNHGNRFTGIWGSELGLSLENPAQHGDVLSIHGTYFGSDMSSGGASYQIPFGGSGKLTAQHSRLYYELGQDFASLDANGKAEVSELSYQYPLSRSRNQNLYVQIGYAVKLLEDRVDSTSTVNNKQSNMMKIGIAGNSVDGKGVTAYSAMFSTGCLQINSQAAQLQDAVTTRSSGQFSKWDVSLTRQHQIDKNRQVYLSFNGQMANKNLDSSEKIFLGGANGVRAYPSGEAAGDDGYIFTAELRQLISSSQDRNQTLQVVGFIDYGSTVLNHNTWPGGPSPNQRNLSGVGIGLIWKRSRDFSFRLDYAWKLGAEEAVSDTDRNGRLWIEATKYF